MLAGEYYVGDLCYVLQKEWIEFCSITIKDRDCLDGEFSLKDGRKFATYGTAYGDGVYDGYSVDACLIGCIKLSDIDKTNKSNSTRHGKIITFDYDFETGENKGVIHFGHIRIDTSFEEEEEIEE